MNEKWPMVEKPHEAPGRSGQGEFRVISIGLSSAPRHVYSGRPCLNPRRRENEKMRHDTAIGNGDRGYG